MVPTGSNPVRQRSSWLKNNLLNCAALFSTAATAIDIISCNSTSFGPADLAGLSCSSRTPASNSKGRSYAFDHKGSFASTRLAAVSGFESCKEFNTWQSSKSQVDTNLWRVLREGTEQVQSNGTGGNSHHVQQRRYHGWTELVRRQVVVGH